MKTKISVSIDKEKLEEIDRKLEEGRFRNRSHLLEYSLTKLLEEKND